jgi:hypothetical protein
VLSKVATARIQEEEEEEDFATVISDPHTRSPTAEL